MPGLAAALPLIQAGVGIGESIMAPIFQGAANKKNRKFAKEMYNLQRQHAIEDRDWMAAYNSPAAQMQRLKDANLNPNLVYGDGNSIQSAPSTRSSTPGSYDAKPLPVGRASESIAAYQSIKQAQAQTDTLKKQLEVMDAEAQLKYAQTLSTLTSHESGQFDLHLKSDLRETSVEMSKALLEKVRGEIDLNASHEVLADSQTNKTIAETILTHAKTKQTEAETGYLADKNTRDWIQTRLNQAKTTADIQMIGREMLNKALEYEVGKLKGHMQIQEIAGKKLDNIIKELDAQLASRGTRPGDPVWYRVIKDAVKRIADETKKVANDPAWNTPPWKRSFWKK